MKPPGCICPWNFIYDFVFEDNPYCTVHHPEEPMTLEEKLQESKGRLLRAAHELTLFSAGIATDRSISPHDRGNWRHCIERAQGALDSYEYALKRIEAARTESNVL